MNLSLNVLISQDPLPSHQLVLEKEKTREMARYTHDRHLHRLQSGTPESIETSRMCIDIARSVKETPSLLVIVAHPIFTCCGDQLASRLANTP